jgi:transcriptional regulator GlxA family with amidase domain
MRIEIVVFDGFDELDAIGPLEVFSQAAGLGAPFEVTLVGIEGPGEVTASHGTRLIVSSGLGRPEAVLVPGGGWLDRAPEGAWAQAQRGVLPAKLAQLAPSLTWIASVCTGGMLLAASGVLAGRTATTNRNALDEMRAVGGFTVLTNRVVDDGNVITAGGITSGFDLGLRIVEREAGADLAAQVAHVLEYPASGDIWQAAKIGSDTAR